MFTINNILALFLALFIITSSLLLPFAGPSIYSNIMCGSLSNYSLGVACKISEECINETYSIFSRCYFYGAVLVIDIPLLYILLPALILLLFSLVMYGVYRSCLLLIDQILLPEGSPKIHNLETPWYGQDVTIESHYWSNNGPRMDIFIQSSNRIITRINISIHFWFSEKRYIGVRSIVYCWLSFILLFISENLSYLDDNIVDFLTI